MACGKLGHVNISDEAKMTQNNQRFQTDLRCPFSFSSTVSSSGLFLNWSSEVNKHKSVEIK